MRSNNRITQRYFEELEQDLLIGLAKESTIAQRKKAVNKFLQFLNRSRINLKNLTSLNLQDFLHFLSQKEPKTGKKLAPATIKQVYALVKSFYVRCYERGITSKHPDLVFIRNLLRRYKLGERKLPKYINQENMKRILNECPDRWRLLLYFMYETGARIGEVLTVKIDHLDLNKKIVQIFEPKTMNFRVTTLSDRTIHLLNEYLKTHRPKPRRGYESFLFINQQRRKMSPRAVQYIVKRYSSKILGEKNAITPHYFRAACAVHLLESGVDIRQVQEIIGWKSLSIVQNYTRVTPHRQAELKEKHHPSFQVREQKSSMSEKKSFEISNSNEDLLYKQGKISNKHQQGIDELKKEFQQEIENLKRHFQQEQQKITHERQEYEQRIGELLKSQQEMNDLLKSQQQVIQLLAKKTS
ncbi:MAG: tyrosine-type recombinase/integrase [Candidatus Hodarchaeota archaeon]